MRRIVLIGAIACYSILGLQSVHSTVASVKGLGMGGACVTYPLDSGVMAFNPAGIAFLCDRVDAACYFITNFGSTTTSGNHSLLAPTNVNRKDNNRLKSAQSPELGFVYHLFPQVAIGASLYNEKDLRVTYNRSFALLGTSPVGFQYTLEVFAPTIAVKILEHHSFSATLNYMIQRLKIKGLERIANTFIPFSTEPAFVTNRGYDYSNGTAVSLGYLGRFFNDRLNLGFCWRSKGEMKRFSQYKGFVAERGQFSIPEIYRLGISATPLCDWTFALDYEFVRYKKIPSLNNPFILFSPNLLGSSNGSGFGWDNQHIFRMGVNYDWSRNLSLRVGYRTANINFGGKNTPPNLLTLDLTNHFITTGFTYLFSDHLEGSGAFAYGARGRKKGALPIELGGGSVQIEQQTVFAGFEISWYY